MIDWLTYLLNYNNFADLNFHRTVQQYVQYLSKVLGSYIFEVISCSYTVQLPVTYLHSNSPDTLALIHSTMHSFRSLVCRLVCAVPSRIIWIFTKHISKVWWNNKCRLYCASPTRKPCILGRQKIGRKKANFLYKKITEGVLYFFIIILKICGIIVFGKDFYSAILWKLLWRKFPWPVRAFRRVQHIPSTYLCLDTFSRNMLH